MKNKIFIITVCIVLCLALLPLSSFSSHAAQTSNVYSPSYVADTGGYVTPTITSSEGSWFGSGWSYVFMPDMYLKYTLRTNSTTTQSTVFRVLYEDVLTNVSSTDLIEVYISFATLVDPVNTLMSIIDANGTSKNATFYMTTTYNISSNDETCDTYNFTALINDFSGLVAPYDIAILLDVPYVYVPDATVYTGDCYIPFTDLRITFNETSSGDTSGGDTSSGDTSGDTSSGDTSGGDTSGGDVSGGSGGSYDDTELINRIDELLSSVETTNQTLVSINSNLTDAPLYLVNKIENAKLQIEAEKDKQEQIQDGLNDLDFPDQEQQDQLLNDFGNAFSGFDGFGDIGGTEGATLREVWSAIWGWDFCVSALGIVASMIVIHKIMFG